MKLQGPFRSATTSLQSSQTQDQDHYLCYRSERPKRHKEAKHPWKNSVFHAHRPSTATAGDRANTIPELVARMARMTFLFRWSAAVFILTRGPH
ncbi:uncharacterized protein Bfra_003898 [Botrytis fragariae]|uniref:Uncharacterized protein n=1 Tax=Botrytis fragariae TaxID=1964551 RepID=A0A8H6EKD6_9HELO|nr:uncharacterized protein Bfra_003898 [Botrytis fragariae]KAF5875444.1 hypothetical protein Bfra_003898 [Botrytis fragariae]